MPVMVGLEGESASLDAIKEVVDPPPLRRSSRKKIIPPAETGRPETGIEFARRMKKHFVLKGPKSPEEQKEGETVAETTETQAKPKLVDREVQTTPDLSPEEIRDIEIATRAEEIERSVSEMEPVSLEEMLANGREPIDLLKAVKGKYETDPVFGAIVKNPKGFKNFEYTEDKLLYMRSNGKMVLVVEILDKRRKDVL
ncbi:hypothetical protein H0H93_010335 [Arthromyces matolae]|nr:hypothetical protein H0H93_010335 [Arthromyces matolae]